MIEHEKFDFNINKDKPWHQFQRTEMLCPHCSVKLKYDLKSKAYIYILGVIFLGSMILSLLNYLPIISVFIAPVLAIPFWKYRKLCIY